MRGHTQTYDAGEDDAPPVATQRLSDADAEAAWADGAFGADNGYEGMADAALMRAFSDGGAGALPPPPAAGAPAAMPRAASRHDWLVCGFAEGEDN